MRIKTYYPQHEFLKPYIHCFYTLKRNEEEKPITYLGFPSNIVYLTLVTNAGIVFKENELDIVGRPNRSVESILIVDTQKQGPCTYKGACDEITIYFKPLGISSFLPKPFSSYLTGPISLFNPYNDYLANITNVFDNSDDLARIANLEEYLLSKLKPFKHSFLQNMLRLIADNDSYPIRINDLSAKFGTSRTTLHKEFVKHTGIPPQQFIKIERFRKAIQLFTRNATKDQLVDIAYMTDYFDQSHMAKDFKSLTGYTPKSFFSKLSQFENGSINWIFS